MLEGLIYIGPLNVYRYASTPKNEHQVILYDTRTLNVNLHTGHAVVHATFTFYRFLILVKNYNAAGQKHSSRNLLLAENLSSYIRIKLRCREKKEANISVKKINLLSLAKEVSSSPSQG